MKKTLGLLFILLTPACFAIGPNELNFNEAKYIKQNEKVKDYIISASYVSTNSGSGDSMTIMHVMGKNDPVKLVKGLKGKKSVEVLETKIIKEDKSDLLVSFIKFDVAHSKVENNLCRIKRNSNNNGCVIVQYINTKRMKGQEEGMTPFDFTKISENMEQLPIDKYLTSMSETFTGSPYQYENRIPWYKRPGARAGHSFF